MISTFAFLIFIGTGIFTLAFFTFTGLTRLLLHVVGGQPLRGVAHWKVLLIVICISFVGAFAIASISQSMAKTPAIREMEEDESQESIAELFELELNERLEWISVRGKDQSAPVLLFLAGGPGGSQMAAVRHELGELEEHFVVVNWDQPGSAKSYRAASSNEITIDMYVDDGCALVEYLCDRFEKDSIYLVGESWGSALGVMMSKEMPERIAGFIGTGQMVDFVETEIRDYQLALELAEKNQNEKKILELEGNGSPPYRGKNVALKSNVYLGYLSDHMMKNPEIYNGGYNTFRDLFSSEYGVVDQINFFRGLLTTFNQVYPQLYGTDLKKDYPVLDVPVAFFLGRHDINAPTDLAEAYFDVLEAPVKEVVWFEHSGHNPWMNESELFVQELLNFTGVK